MWIKISPNDTLFFRSGRPFSMGSETWADVIFPPYPSTIYGALRTFLIFERGSLREFKSGKYKDIGTPDKKGTMKIIGPLIFNFENGRTYFPAPLDLVMKKENKKKDKLFQISKLKKPEIFYAEYPLEDILIYQEREQVESAEGYIDSINFKEYLQGQSGEYILSELSEFYIPEPKIGIARDDITLSSKEGYLYRAQMIRLKKDYCLLVKINEIDSMPEKGLFTLGGEGKTVRFEKINNNPLEDLEDMDFEPKNRIFKLYLATHTIFEKGWLPKWINEETMEGEKDGIKLKLIACAIGKCLRIGGWDMTKNEPKPMYKAVPAGSVYYFKVLSGSFEKIKEVFHFKNISDINPEEGFGLSCVGVVV
ncbi:MAG: type III-B CRISPR module-associated protein Cmr3 [Candidatus Omnitrophica bacterium]|nr:type III-B CRISPR module-associated protein Cmr3 [Candidatus Omnitrophota bacterium]